MVFVVEGLTPGSHCPENFVEINRSQFCITDRKEKSVRKFSFFTANDSLLCISTALKNDARKNEFTALDHSAGGDNFKVGKNGDCV